MSPRLRSIVALLILASLLVAGWAWLGGPTPASRALADGRVPLVHVYDGDGELTGPVVAKPVEKSAEAWQRILTEQQYEVLREAGTEPPFTGDLLKNTDEGVYACAGCKLPLFSSKAKFKSGTGWPSFYEPIAAGNVAERLDRSLGVARVEILCPRCGGHLGHVFEDGPRPTGLRYCVNSAALSFTPAGELAALADPAASGESAQATAVVAGGCFWCVEAVFEEIEGVLAARSGYAGGSADDARYGAVASGRTEHAEAVQLVYDPSVISYEDLLRVHLATHDPTQLNRQGNDVGPQYRSAIFYATPRQKAVAEAVIRELADKGVYDEPIVTTLEPLEMFHPAEAYHQDYVRRHPDDPYVRAVALPKVEKARKLFKERLKSATADP